MDYEHIKNVVADIDELIKDYSYSPSTDIKSGIDKFINWFIDYKKK